jgi:O-antigen/teichoic acid export membrane protein
MVINIAISFPAIVFNSHVTAKEKFIFQKSLQLVRVIANPLLVLPVLIMGYGSIGMVVVITALNLAIEISNMLFCFKKLRIQFTFREFDFSLMKEMAVFSSFIFMNLIVNQINWNVDRFILGRFHGAIAVATYSLSSQLNAYYLSLSTAISNVFVPRVNKMVSSENDSSALTSLFTSVGRMQFFVLSMVFTGLIFFGRPFISMWAGADYAESYPIALLLIIPVTIPLIQNLGIEIQRAKNMHKFRSWVYLFIAIGNILITIPLVKLYGGIGAAAGTAIALIVGNIFIMNWYYHRRVGLNILFFWKRIISILPSTIPPVLLGLFLSSYFDLFELHMLIICGLCYIVFYTISIWLFGLNEYEKSLVIKPLNKIQSKLLSK